MKNNKIYQQKTLSKILKRFKKAKKTIVFTNGCFDILHLGHVKLFLKAKSLGDILIVALNSDKSIKRLKGTNRPIVDQKARAQMLATLEPVDFVVVFNEDTPAQIIKTLKPDVLVKGADYKEDQIVGRNDVKKVVRFAIVDGYSTTKLVNKIIKLYEK